MTWLPFENKNKKRSASNLTLWSKTVGKSLAAVPPICWLLQMPEEHLWHPRAVDELTGSCVDQFLSKTSLVLEGFEGDRDASIREPIANASRVMPRKLGSYYEYLRIKQVSSNMLRALTTTCLDMEAQSKISLSFVQVKLERTPPSHPGPNCRRSSSIMKKKVVAHLPHGALQIFVRKAITMRK